MSNPTNDELFKIVENFKLHTLGNNRPNGMCGTVCIPLSIYLNNIGVDNLLTGGLAILDKKKYNESDKKYGSLSHYWLTKVDGIIIDPTANQFSEISNMPPTYVGKIKDWYDCCGLDKITDIINFTRSLISPFLVNPITLTVPQYSKIEKLTFLSFHIKASNYLLQDLIDRVNNNQTLDPNKKKITVDYIRLISNVCIGHLREDNFTITNYLPNGGLDYFLSGLDRSIFGDLQ